MNSDLKFKVVAIISAFNEEDIIYQVIGDLISQGIHVYLINNCSTDATVECASKWLGQGLLCIENFPQDASYSKRNRNEFIQSEINTRKQEVVHSIDADWFIHHDADEFRESPWPEYNLLEAIKHVDSLGYNAIDFELLNFRPVDNNFVPGTDVREALQYYEGSEPGNELQIKAWKKQSNPVDLVSLAGHSVVFEGRRVCPVKFILRHYPVRSQTHGMKKVILERKIRFNSFELIVKNWHKHYNGIDNEKHNFLHDPNKLNKYDPGVVRQSILKISIENIVGTESDSAVETIDDIFRHANAKQTNRWLRKTIQNVYIREMLFMFGDCIDMLQFTVKAVVKLFRRNI